MLPKGFSVYFVLILCFIVILQPFSGSKIINIASTKRTTYEKIFFYLSSSHLRTDGLDANIYCQ